MIVCLFAVFLVSGCGELMVEAVNVHPLVGTWIQRDVENEVMIMERTFHLDTNKYGFIFYVQGTFLERKNAGWCGTPPIVYTNFTGQWKSETNDLLTIDVDYWGGREEYTMEIISVTTSELRFRRSDRKTAVIPFED